MDEAEPREFKRHITQLKRKIIREPINTEVIEVSSDDEPSVIITREKHGLPRKQKATNKGDKEQVEIVDEVTEEIKPRRSSRLNK